MIVVGKASVNVDFQGNKVIHLLHGTLQLVSLLFNAILQILAL